MGGCTIKQLAFLLIVVIFPGMLLPQSVYPADEAVTITTYYPAPYGIYKDLRSQRVAIGNTYFDDFSHPWDSDSNVLANEIPQSASLVVEGDVGIGTYQPAARLHVDNQGSVQPVTLLFDDSTPPDGGWRNDVVFARAGAPQASLGISGNTTIADIPVLQFFAIDVPATAATDIVLDAEGNIGLGAAALQTPSNTEAGSINVNDIFIRRTRKWLSTMLGGASGYEVYVVRIPPFGASNPPPVTPEKLNKPTFLFFDTGNDTTAKDSFQWGNTPFRQTPLVVFGRSKKSYYTPTGPSNDIMARPLNTTSIGSLWGGPVDWSEQYFMVIGEGS